MTTFPIGRVTFRFFVLLNTLLFYSHKHTPTHIQFSLIDSFSFVCVYWCSQWWRLRTGEEKTRIDAKTWSRSWSWTRTRSWTSATWCCSTFDFTNPFSTTLWIFFHFHSDEYYDHNFCSQSQLQYVSLSHSYSYNVISSKIMKNWRFSFVLTIDDAIDCIVVTPSTDVSSINTQISNVSFSDSSSTTLLTNSQIDSQNFSGSTAQLPSGSNSTFLTNLQSSDNTTHSVSNLSYIHTHTHIHTHSFVCLVYIIWIKCVTELKFSLYLLCFMWCSIK
jgi:hypothetical protein